MQENVTHARQTVKIIIIFKRSTIKLEGGTKLLFVHVT